VRHATGWLGGPAGLATHKWRRLTYENMESALIRGNYFWMSL
jgi:hypothetical protein